MAAIGYRPGASWLHRAHPRAKLLAGFLLVPAVLAAFSLPQFAALLPLIVIGTALSGTSWLRFLKGISSVLPLLVILAAISLFTHRAGPLFFAARLLAILWLVHLLISTTSPYTLGRGLGRIFGSRAGFLVALVFRYWPLLEEERERLWRAQLLRGAPLESRNPWLRMRGLAALLLPLFVLSFRKAEKVALLLHLRGVSFAGRERERWHFRDTALVGASLVSSAVILALPRWSWP